MATSLPFVTLPSNTWVDLCAATGLDPGKLLIVQNIGSSVTFLVESATQPANSSGYNVLCPREYAASAAFNVGSWALSELGTTLQVEKA
jgi:hypothetical protein